METVAFMVVVAIGSLAVGAALRLLQWTVLSVVPAMLVATIAIAGVGLARSYGFWPIIAEVVVSATCLQFGYLVGQTVRPGGRAQRRGSAPRDGT
jgi:hypothetical protein